MDAAAIRMMSRSAPSSLTRSTNGGTRDSTTTASVPVSDHWAFITQSPICLRQSASFRPAIGFRLQVLRQQPAQRRDDPDPRQVRQHLRGLPVEPALSPGHAGTTSFVCTLADATALPCASACAVAAAAVAAALVSRLPLQSEFLILSFKTVHLVHFDGAATGHVPGGSDRRSL